MKAVLWGKDHTELGKVAVRVVSDRVALALTRGRFGKAYGYVDPNEDAVAAAVGARAILLVVADGHNGWEATEVAVRAVLQRLGDDPPPADLTDEELVGLFSEASSEVLRVTSRLPWPNRQSRTTLTVGLLAGRRLQWAGMGDSALIVADRRGGRELTHPHHHFVGYPMSDEAVRKRLWHGQALLDGQAWVVAASDGFTNFADPRDPAGAVAGVLTGAAGAATAAGGG
ncbi:MAG TPA: protein phosphatase 2C domain-containing protein, partial [Egibacteraceae bacterium]|nr:protein phosphatase 2C domain-containing protein [Egibacteraceae bacterium]